MRLKTIESEFRHGGYEDQPYGEGTAREHFKDYIAGTIQLFDVDTSEWGDDVPDDMLELVGDEIMEHHGVDREALYELNIYWFKNDKDGNAYIDYQTK